MAEEKLRGEQEAQERKEQKRREQQRQVSKVLLDGLHDPNSNLSSLRGTQRIMRVIWHACSGMNKLVNTWEDFPADPSPPADETPSSGVSKAKGTQTVKLLLMELF